jgi:hypothetical protein
MRDFVINEDFANAILNYLVSKPFAEVHPFVKGFQDLITVEMYLEKNKNVTEFKKD